METNLPAKQCSPQVPKKFNSKALRLSLKFRPKIYRLIMRMRICIRQKNAVIKTLKERIAHLDKITNQNSKAVMSDDKTESVITGSQLSTAEIISEEVKNDDADQNMWGESKEGENKSIADQVKEVAQSALQQNGMVYVESAGMYYDYKTGYYYNPELGLYYHNDTGCYYYYSEDQKNFVFHSYPDRNALAANASLIAHEKRKARKQKKEKKRENTIDELTKSLSQDKQDTEPRKVKKRKLPKKTKTKDNQIEEISETNEGPMDIETEANNKNNEEAKPVDTEKKDEIMEVDLVPQELEDGECSDTGSEAKEADDDEESNTSTSTVSDDESISKHHPPCMRVIVRETSLARLKVGTLYLVTKTGGTLGREGDHTVLIRDTNISRTHLKIKYDMARRVYLAIDLGSKNGTILNGQRMSESQVVSQPMEVVHGSILQVGETKLLCHIHAGTDTCGHCEPGLIMETEEKEKKSAYTRTCSKSKQYQLELARLKNKYAPQPLMIEEKEYNDRAEARRRQVGSTHSSEKTQTADLDTAIASDNKGFKLMEKMGWSQGEGLGKENQGDTEPIPLVSNDGKAGLGTSGAVGPPDMNPPPKPRNKLGPATIRLASMTKMLHPPAKAFQLVDEDDE